MFNWPELGHMASLSLKQKSQTLTLQRASPVRRRPEIEGVSVVPPIPASRILRAPATFPCFCYRRVTSFALTASGAGMSLPTTWLAVATIPAFPSQQADKDGQCAVLPAERKLPDHWDRRVKSHLNKQTRDFQSSTGA